MNQQHDDFFAALGGHLDRAAQRRARWGRLADLPRPAAIAAPALAILLLGVLVVTGGLALSRDDAEVAAPPQGGWTAYGSFDCRQGLAPTSLAVLRRPRTAADAEAVRLWGDRGTGPMPKVWPDAGRMARPGGGDTPYAVYPAALHCDAAGRGEPGACLLRGGPGEVGACFTTAQIAEGRSVLPGDEGAALVPDGIRNAEIVEGDRRRTGEVRDNVLVVAEPVAGGPQLRWEALDAPADYGCDGPVHPETLAAYSVLRGEPDEDVRFQAPDGVSFLSAPVLAREAFGHRFWLIPAATPPDCGAPLICVATDFSSPEPSCGPVDAERSTPVVTRVEPDGEPTLVAFAAAPDDLGNRKVNGLEMSFGGNLLVGGATLPEEDARRFAERVSGAQAP